MLEPLCEQVACCGNPTNDTDTTNIQKRMLTQVLRMLATETADYEYD